MAETRMIGGPLDGQTIEVEHPRQPLLVEVPESPGLVARYRPAREKGTMRFREYDRVVGSVPVAAASGGGDADA